MNIPKINGTLHKVHFFADLSIGSFALIGLVFAGVLDTFFQVDLYFHITIIVLTFGGILTERIFHRHKHRGVIV